MQWRYLFPVLALLVLVSACETPNPPPATPSPPTIMLTDSGPITVARDDQVIENVRINASNGHGITVINKRNVVIRNCLIQHRNGAGIFFRNSPGIRIENCHIIHTGAPASGPNPSETLNNITGEISPGAVIDNVRLEKGSSGIYLTDSPNAVLTRVEGRDFRGPFPRGQLVQFSRSHNSRLENFSSINGRESWVEDNLSAWRSSNVVFRNGYLEGNNSPSGVGVMFEQDDGASSGGLVEDVHLIKMGNGAVSAYPGRNVIFRNIGVRDNICTDQGRGTPLSGGLSFSGSPSSSNLRVENSRYFNLCHIVLWDRQAFSFVELKQENFALKTPFKARFGWE